MDKKLRDDAINEFGRAYDKITKLQAQVAQLRYALKAVEWSGDVDGFSVCPECTHVPSAGHSGGCQLDIALAATEEGE